MTERDSSRRSAGHCARIAPLATATMRRHILRELERHGPLLGAVPPAQRRLSWRLDAVDASLDRQGAR